ncbi:rhodanese-like domain-containing protein [Pelagibacteraceae bacterium]|nr:rhodanese-like domain-containing protein [Pelagibacteraceae bacterium]
MSIKSSKTLVDEALKLIETIDPTEAKQLQEQKKCTLIDIRDIRELHSQGGIEDAIHIPRGMLEFWLDPGSPYYKKEKFDDINKKMVLFCAGGLRSALATKSLKEMGYKNIAHINGGFASMIDNGFKVVKE